jgi:hypothetical protein
VVEKVFPRAGGPSTDKGDIVVRGGKQDKSSDGPNKRTQGATSAAALRKGKARV